MRVTVTLFVCLVTGIVQAAEPKPGESKSASCMACHGVNGISPTDAWPNLAGQKKGYLVAQMKAFRSGERENMMMTPLAKGLKDPDIEEIAGYFSSLKVTP
jgi:cytochrome c553